MEINKGFRAIHNDLVQSAIIRQTDPNWRKAEELYVFSVTASCLELSAGRLPVIGFTSLALGGYHIVKASAEQIKLNQRMGENR